MADRTPAEKDLDRNGPQLTAAEARTLAGDAATRVAKERDVEVPLNEGVGRADGVDLADSAARGASGGAGYAPASERAPDDRPFTDSETALGGADAIQKTTYGVGHGAEPSGREEFAPVGLRKGEGAVVSRVASGGGVSPIIWVVGVLGIVAFALYAFGVFA